MWIYILVGVLGFLLGWFLGECLLSPHTEGCIIVDGESSYLELNEDLEDLQKHQFVVFRVISRK